MSNLKICTACIQKICLLLRNVKYLGSPKKWKPFYKALNLQASAVNVEEIDQNDTILALVRALLYVWLEKENHPTVENLANRLDLFGLCIEAGT